ncbi:MAG: hypothetical protein ACNA8R_00945 [Nitriliruptoraceae bacterium]
MRPSGSGDAAATGPDAAPRARRTATWLLALVLLLVAGGGVALGFVASDQRDVASDWRDRAERLEEQRDVLDAERTSLSGQLDEALAALQTSERDVAELEARVLELAEEKARAEDTATTVQVERDVFIELSDLIVDATASLDTCVTQLFELQTASVEAFNRANLGQSVDIDALNARAGEVTRFCNEARGAAASAQAAAEQLRRS